MTGVPTAGRRRSTQAERRAGTRLALLEATIECVVVHGYAGTTTGRIAETAGVSRGAQLPYFRNRDEMVIAAVAHLAEKRIAAFASRFDGAEASLEDCLDALWEEHRGPVFAAALELWVASRSDPALRENVLRIERDVSAGIAATARTVLGDAASRPGFAERLVHALAAIRGLALLEVSHGVSSRGLAVHWRHTRTQLLQMAADQGLVAGDQP